MLISQHGVSLAGGGLPVHKDGTVASFTTEIINDIPAAFFIYFLVGVSRPKRIIICKLISMGFFHSR